MKKDRSPNRQSKETTSHLDTTKMYLNEIGYAKLLTPEQEVFYARKAQQGDENSRKKMIECNLRLVVKIARRYLNRGLPLLDLIEEGNLGLIKAVKKFDPEMGYRFSTYATWWIRQTIERGLMNQSRTIRLPVHVIKEINVYRCAVHKLSLEQEQKPTPEEIAKLLDKPVEKVQELIAYSQHTHSIENNTAENDEYSLLDIQFDEDSVQPQEVLEETRMRLNVDRWLAMLSQRQREVVERRFGLHGYNAETLDKVGDEIGVTRERVRQIQLEALKKLKTILKDEGFDSNLIFNEK
ncbi:MAG: RNA polymerase sigma factor RpoS [Gammaproteobacteria bacterium]|nr:RNA polymerase sigma factor RpoS [Gammaproteobacteria bacterium]